MTINNVGVYKDKNGNNIDIQCKQPKKLELFFRDGIATNNTIIVHKDAVISHLVAQFTCSNAVIEIGKVNDGKFFLQVGESCSIKIGNDVTCTGVVTIFTAEGTSCSIGNDCMFSNMVIIKTHDHHPIFDVSTKKRVNYSKNILINDHVWIGERVFISKGSIINQGSVIGFGSFVSSTIPNNCIAAGIPAKVIKTNIAWERPLLNWTEPFYKPDASCIKTTSFWDYTNIIP